METEKGDSYVVDANHTYSLLLTKRGEAYPERAADQAIPPDMVELLQLGRSSMDAVREAERLALEEGVTALEKLEGRRTIFRAEEVKLNHKGNNASISC